MASYVRILTEILSVYPQYYAPTSKKFGGYIALVLSVVLSIQNVKLLKPLISLEPRLLGF